MGWIAGYVVLIPLLVGIVWAIYEAKKRKRLHEREIERIRQRIAEKEREGNPTGKSV